MVSNPSSLTDCQPFPAPQNWIAVLGPVRAWRGEQELSLGPPQQRLGLALLVVAGGDPVPRWGLVDAIWKDSPPHSAVNVVQTYVKRLRQVLDPDRPARGPSPVLPRTGDGYALRAAPEAVDLWRFRHLFGQARQSRRQADHPRAADLLGEALRLWHGPPAADLPELERHPRLRTVTEEYTAAVNWFAEATLHTAAAADALPVVEETAAAHPWDERLHAQLIRIYHALGRRGDAVQVFQRSQRRLREELGLAPVQS